MLIEIECVLNSRPLTYVEDDTGAISYTLSPSHLIYGRRVTNNPNSSHFEIISTHEVLTKRARIQSHLLQQFTRQWCKEYLLSLRETHKNNYHGKGGSVISVGDIVVLKDDTKRMFWKLAVVQELLTGADKQVRAAIVSLGKSGRQSQLLRRSVKHLYPLEVTATTRPFDSPEDTSCNLERRRSDWRNEKKTRKLNS